MTRSTFSSLAMHVAAILFIFFVLFISFAQQTLYKPTIEEQQLRAKISLLQRVQELRQWPLDPDHPLYLLLMIHDRLRLLRASETQQVTLKLKYADTRLKSAQRLITRGRYTLALTTITKAEKYILSAASDIVRLYPGASAFEREELIKTIGTHEKTLFAMKASFSDEQRAVIDQLLAQLSIVLPH